MKIVLIGFKGCGKTYLASYLAKHLNVTFYDTDELIKNLFLQKHKKRLPISEIYRFLQDKLFRQLESKAFDCLKKVDKGVIATGGGSILDINNLKKIEGEKIIFYLKASLEVIKKRIEKKSIFSNRSFLEKTFFQREELYHRYADHVIEIDNKNVEDLINEIVCKIYG